MTRNEKRVLKRVMCSYPEWVVATGSGERVTLAALYRKGILRREQRRGGIYPAHRYQLSRLAVETLRLTLIGRKTGPP